MTYKLYLKDEKVLAMKVLWESKLLYFVLLYKRVSVGDKKDFHLKPANIINITCLRHTVLGQCEGK